MSGTSDGSESSYIYLPLECLLVSSTRNNSVPKITVKIDDQIEWNICYIHTTDSYDENNYINSSDSEVETQPVERTFTINFGKSKKYYIKGNGNNRFKIYKNSKNDLRIINTDYDVELDLDEQYELMDNYSNNPHIPEWLAIKVFVYMNENGWSDKNLTTYLSLI